MIISKKTYICLFSFSLMLTVKLFHAQDFHLSQYDANPLYLNPALTGMNLAEDWKFRINANYREQGNKYISGSNTTVAAGFDVPVNEKFSVGQFVIDNKTIGNAFNTFNFIVSGSYKITGNKTGENPHMLSTGIQIGILQKSITPANFSYDSQYSPATVNGFDKTIPSGENFTKQNILKFDANIGIYYRFLNKEKKLSPFAGFSIYHLTQPNESFIGEANQTPMRFVFHSGSYIQASKELKVLMQVLYMNQANANELNIGVIGFYKINETDYEPMAGIGWKNKDAIVFHCGLKHRSNIFRISYDINGSYLNQYYKSRSAIELSVIVTRKKKTVPSSEPFKALNENREQTK